MHPDFSMRETCKARQLEWAEAKRNSRDARLFDSGVKFIVVTVDGELAKITMKNGEVFWCRCADIAMQ
ncbi:MAG: hypothetical protein IKZ07_01395 [Akkermansia sp.]|nr:hypothetical protein [Akkermansia sp.]